ncbi:hypothetical protein [Roseicitreum antarcticum]|uniref:Phosphomannomutase n=1 Tax=Roseicitreum antarcticum TaxID=564137 RepID=A0A1H2XZ32_9RHOB|nr:hypothetical protein [Roseicitreum antarcticum]SDW98137.1 hypothetical protein SAMN04488238_104360 [Roseicitreum antarcticum]
MFSIEHEFDATIITLVDEGADNGTPLLEDVIVSSFEDCITLAQYDARTDQSRIITLSMSQARDLAAALNLPEGVYRINKP